MLSLTSQTLAIPKDKNLVPADVRYIALMLGLFGAITVAAYMFLAHQCWKFLRRIFMRGLVILLQIFDGLRVGVRRMLGALHGDAVEDIELTP